MDLSQQILLVGYRHTIREANVEAAFERFVTRIDRPVFLNEFQDALDACLRDGLIREPIRLPEGALQCHWRLELTPKGIDIARDLAGQE